jgi:arabinan endo-1,5-alpha-L-arabinosidase
MFTPASGSSSEVGWRALATLGAVILAAGPGSAQDLHRPAKEGEEPMTTPRRFVACMSAAALLWAGYFLLPPTHADTLNPTIQVHDPSRMVFSPDDGRWYIFFTGNGTPFMWSTDKVNWNRNNTTDRVWPAIVDNFNYWAPDMWDTPIHGKYYLFYSQSSFGSQTSFIHVASTTSLASPAVWVKEGTAINSVPSGPPRRYNAIDPCLYYDEENDRLWLAFGSFWDGIFIKELNPHDPTEQIEPDVPPIFLAGGRRPDPPNSIEGAYVFKRGDWFYLVVSVDTCCSSGTSTYKQIVGRSPVITGPYFDRDGVDLREYGGTIFTSGGGPEIGPGQFALYELNGVDRFTYHHYTGGGGNAARLGGRSIDWDEAGWPLAVFPGPVAEGMYRIQRQSTSLYLHARDEATDPDVEGRVEQDLLGTRKSQNWFVFPKTTPGGDTSYTIQNVGTKLWLSIADHPDNRLVINNMGTDFVRMEHASELPRYENQMWRLVAGAGAQAGTVNLMSYRSGLSIGLPNSGNTAAPTTPMLPVVQKPWISTQQASMRFVLQPVVDTTPPTLRVSASPNVLWPPNHKMVNVTVTPIVDDDIDPKPTVKIVSIASNEPLVGDDTGNFAPDWEITGDLTAQLRAERSGTGSGRIYTIAVEATDFSGNTTTEHAIVTVPLEK